MNRGRARRSYRHEGRAVADANRDEGRRVEDANRDEGREVGGTEVAESVSEFSKISVNLDDESLILAMEDIDLGSVGSEEEEPSGTCCMPAWIKNSSRRVKVVLTISALLFIGSVALLGISFFGWTNETDGNGGDNRDGPEKGSGTTDWQGGNEATLHPTFTPTSLAASLNLSNSPTTRPTTLPPTRLPTDEPTSNPTSKIFSTIPPTPNPSFRPSTSPTALPAPSQEPSHINSPEHPNGVATVAPSAANAPNSSHYPTGQLTDAPTASHVPTYFPSRSPSYLPSDAAETSSPSSVPYTVPSDISSTSSTTWSQTDSPTTASPTAQPTTLAPTYAPSYSPTTASPTAQPTTLAPTYSPTTASPIAQPTTLAPTYAPSYSPTTASPTAQPTTLAPTGAPTHSPTKIPTKNPTMFPSGAPTMAPSQDCTDRIGLFVNNNGAERTCAWLDDTSKKLKNCGSPGYSITELGESCPESCSEYYACPAGQIDSCADKPGAFENQLGNLVTCSWLDRLARLDRNCGTDTFPQTELGEKCPEKCSSHYSCS